MKLFAALTVGLLLPGCGGQAAHGPAPHAPRIALVSAAGKQWAVPGTYCLHTESSGVCADSAAPHPQELSVLPTADSLSLVLARASLDGPATITVRHLGCEREELATLRVTTAKPFALELGPGRYQADVFTRFRDGEDGSSGDVSGSVGIAVRPGAGARIVSAPSGRSGC